MTAYSSRIEKSIHNKSSNKHIYNGQIYHQIHAGLAEITSFYKNNYRTEVECYYSNRLSKAYSHPGYALREGQHLKTLSFSYWHLDKFSSYLPVETSERVFLLGFLTDCIEHVSEG